MTSIRLKCPNCELPLAPGEGGWCCDNGHRFDRARRGYTNLLLAQQRRSRAPGDDKEMVRSRTAFLERGRYQPLADALIELLPDQPEAWVDVGCGEGWYTEQFAGRLGSEAGIGVDISKPAVDAAARRSKTLTWLVASGARLPLFDQSMDRAFVLFAYLFEDELARILKPGGELIVVGAGERHLLPLREALYEEVRTSDFDVTGSLDNRFERLSRQQLQVEWQPETLEELKDLLTMTPHHWRAKPEAKAQIDSLIGTSMEAEFVIERWRSKAQV